MKRLIVALLVVVALAALLTSTVMAAPPTPGSAQTTCPNGGICTGQGLTGRGAMMGRGGMMGAGRGMPAWAGFEEEVATLLKLSQADIQAQRLAGKSLAQIAQAQGVTKDALVSAILAAKKADLDKAVADKTITQAQADAMVQMMQTNIAQMVDRTATGPAMDGRGGMMGQGGCPMLNGGTSNNGTTTAPRMRGPRFAQQG
jgi:hypothetical protein